MIEISTLPIADWSQPCSDAEQQQALAVLESGNVLFFPHLPFSLQDDEKHLLSPEAVTGERKNVSFSPADGTLRGSSADAAELALLRGMMERFVTSTRTLMHNLFPRYAADLVQARASYRPVEVAGRASSWRKDDTRLHVDSFPSSPTQGQRILRVFTNINPNDGAREWRLGEPFEDIAKRFVGSISAPLPGASFALNLLGITKQPRSAYDHYMLHLHDDMKADLAYQANSSQQHYAFPPGSTWIVFADQVSHAVMRGQYLLEQTFHLPVAAMQDPARSPLRTLERLLERRLA